MDGWALPGIANPYDPLGVTLEIACSVEDHGDHSILRVVVLGARCPQAWSAPLAALCKCVGICSSMATNVESCCR